MTKEQKRREALCLWLVDEILFQNQNITPKQLLAARRAYHKLQMQNCKEQQGVANYPPLAVRSTKKVGD